MGDDDRPQAEALGGGQPGRGELGAAIEALLERSRPTLDGRRAQRREDLADRGAVVAGVRPASAGDQHPRSAPTPRPHSGVVGGRIGPDEPTSEHADAVIHWAGGHVTRTAFVRPIRTYAQLRDLERLQKRVVELRAAGQSASAIADSLNGEGYTPLKQGERFTADVVRGLFRKLKVHGEIRDDALLGPDEWWLQDLATAVNASWKLVRMWAVRGWVHARQTNVQRLWIVWADRDEVKRLRTLRSVTYVGRNHFPEDLTTPKLRRRRK